MPPFRNTYQPGVINRIVSEDEKLSPKSPFIEVQKHLRRITELQSQLADINVTARDAVQELRGVEAQLLKEATSEHADPSRIAELYAERDRCRAALDGDLHRARVLAAEGRIRQAVSEHDNYVATHTAELIAALEPELAAAERAYTEHQAAGHPIANRLNTVTDKLQEIRSFA